jgi:hypothetical protein
MNMKKISLLALVLCLMLSLCACGGSEAPAATEAPATEAPATEAPVTEAAPETEATLAEGMAVYTITVVDEGGNPIAGAMVQMCKDSCIPGMTNAEGVASFTMAEDAYKVSFLTMPAGYELVDETTEFYFESGSTEMTLTLKAVA